MKDRIIRILARHLLMAVGSWLLSLGVDLPIDWPHLYLAAAGASLVVAGGLGKT